MELRKEFILVGTFIVLLTATVLFFTRPKTLQVTVSPTCQSNGAESLKWRKYNDDVNKLEINIPDGWLVDVQKNNLNQNTGLVTFNPATTEKLCGIEGVRIYSSKSNINLGNASADLKLNHASVNPLKGISTFNFPIKQFIRQEKERWQIVTEVDVKGQFYYVIVYLINPDNDFTSAFNGILIGSLKFH